MQILLIRDTNGCHCRRHLGKLIISKFPNRPCFGKKSSGLCNFFRASKICLLPAPWACDLKNFLRRLVLEHIVSLNYRIAWWIFTKLGRDKVLMIPHICIDSWAKSAQGWIQGKAKIGPGGSLLQRTSSDRKATATYWMHSSDLEAFGKKYCYFWFHW